MGFSRLQSADLASNLSLNFKQIATSQEDLIARTTKMMEVAAVISNKRGLTMQDVSDRIRSAMNMEADAADELGVNVRIAVIKTSQAYKELADGQPWDELSTSMQKTILYHHILNSVAENLGTTMQDSTALRMAVFTASLADLRMALGQAFLPIIYNVLPLLTALSNALYRALQYVAAFMSALFGGFKYKPPITSTDVANTQAQASALDDVGKSAEKAGKKSKKAAEKSAKAWAGTFGFDEVHTIDEPKDTPTGGADVGGGAGGGGVGGAGGVPMPDIPKEPFKPLLDGMDELVQKMKKYTEPIRQFFIKVWEEVSGYALEKFNQISAWWKENGDQIMQGFSNAWALVQPIIGFLVDWIWESVKGLVDGVITFFEGITEFFAGVFTGDWELAWEGLKKMVFGAIQAIWNFFNLSFLGGIKKGLIKWIAGAGKSWKGWKDSFLKIIELLRSGFKNTWNKIKDVVLGWIQTVHVKFQGWKTNISRIFDDLGGSIKKVWDNVWKKIKDIFGGAVNWFRRVVITPLINGFEDIKEGFKGGIESGLKAVWNKIATPLNKMIDGLNKIKNNIPGVSSFPNVPKLPKLAQGGITSGPMLAMVGDNPGGKEVIAPLDRLQGMLTSAVVQAMGQGGNNSDIVLNVDGRTFARILKPYLENENRRVGTDVRIRTI